AADALRAVGAARTSSGRRASSQAPLDAPARAALRAGDQDRAPAAPGPRAAPGRVWHAGRYRAGPGGVRLADQHGLYRAPQPVDAPACGRAWPARHHAVQTRGRLTPAVDLVPCLL